MSVSRLIRNEEHLRVVFRLSVPSILLANERGQERLVVVHGKLRDLSSLQVYYQAHTALVTSNAHSRDE
jgi:hypothetical protein